MKITVNKAVEEEMRKGLEANGGYCPCAVQKLPETKCMCKEFMESKVSGYCHCGLYYKEIEENG